MKSAIILLAIVATCAANTIFLRDNRFVPIRSLRHEIHPSGMYNMHSEGADGTVFLESSNAVGAKTGQYSYTSPEGELISLSYVADENGFRPTGSHLPVPPPMPAEIKAMLPTLPKLVEVEQPSFFLRREPVVVHESRPFFVSRAPAPVLVHDPLVLPVAPEKTFVQTNEYMIDSSPSKTVVRIGH